MAEELSKVLKVSQLSEKETSYKIDIGNLQGIVRRYKRRTEPAETPAESGNEASPDSSKQR